ncbi:MAG: type II secretion system protein GspK, partial [Candidatus Omnitrophota bacterium]|nr:type II secretion system protein GspK [Candidatus Omnitrophota bacterium]
MRRSGFVMILALVFMLVLAAMVMALAYYVSSETRGVGFQLDDTKALYLAQAGVERAFREIRDEVITPPQTGTADLRGATTTGSSGVTNLARIRYINETANPVNNVATFTTGTAMLRAFDSNYVNTIVASLQVAARAGYTGGTTGATLTVSYTTNNGSTWTALSPPATLTTTVTDYYWTMPTLPWATLMNTTNFRIRAQRTAGNSTVQLDALYLRVSYAVDTNTEQWYDGSYDTFPKSLGDGFIQSVSIVDEARKVHLNSVNLAAPASSLLRYLMQERGIPAATASTLATAIRTYRGNTTISNPFDSVEELQRVTGMTTAYYNLIRDYVTVYSFTNTYTQRPVG